MKRKDGEERRRQGSLLFQIRRLCGYVGCSTTVDVQDGLSVLSFLNSLPGSSWPDSRLREGPQTVSVRCLGKCERKKAPGTSCGRRRMRLALETGKKTFRLSGRRGASAGV
uniref:Uncharacterized protein n=1 Tax=Toxoplasma gondii TgCATBr9 TaxID=943120 RepID=A0A2T6IN11_TOXGO|nr:hypothetical protein TGBR9_316635B [Toxoplasma gondii TgCATBr9]